MEKNKVIIDNFRRKLTWERDGDLVLVSPRFLEVGVSAALAVVLALALSLSVSLSVSVLVFGGLRGRARGQDVVAHVIEDAARTETASVTLRPQRVSSPPPPRRAAAPPTHLRSASGALFSSSLPGETVSPVSIGRSGAGWEEPTRHAYLCPSA